MGETAHRTGEKCTRKGIVGNEGGGRWFSPQHRLADSKTIWARRYRRRGSHARLISKYELAFRVLWRYKSNELITKVEEEEERVKRNTRTMALK